jgi:hypothetical protein
MPTFQRKQVVLDVLDSGRTGQGMSHTTVQVTKTATMTQGSALVAAGTEAALADVATVTGVIDDLTIDNAAVGDVLIVSVAQSFCLFKTANIHFSDAGAFVPANATLLKVLNKFQ